MKTLFLLILSTAALAIAQTTRTAPVVPAASTSTPASTDVPAARHEEISREMLQLQQLQLALQSAHLQAKAGVEKAQAQGQEGINAAQKQAMDGQTKYDAFEEALRIEFHKPKGCHLTITKTWNCPVSQAQ